jgi:hypothetical protein
MCRWVASHKRVGTKKGRYGTRQATHHKVVPAPQSLSKPSPSDLPKITHIYSLTLLTAVVAALSALIQTTTQLHNINQQNAHFLN